MSQDIVADGLNQIMNMNRIGKKKLVINRYSKVLINLFEIMKKKGYIDYDIDEENRSVKVEIVKLNECRAVKPRYFVGAEEIDKYLRRFLPSKNFGSLIISTNKGLLDQKQAIEQNVGGSIIAYFY